MKPQPQGVRGKSRPGGQRHGMMRKAPGPKTGPWRRGQALVMKGVRPGELGEVTWRGTKRAKRNYAAYVKLSIYTEFGWGVVMV